MLEDGEKTSSLI